DGVMVEVAEAGHLPVQTDRAEEGRLGDEIVADVKDLEAPRAAVAQQHVSSVAAEKAAEAGKLPIGFDVAQLEARQDRVAAEVVDFVVACHGGGRVRPPQDHGGGGGGGRGGGWGGGL